ncbi:MAG TPA: potassium transporter, partial [Gammaproteobacteria bacterium]|nr:potassium transporter [Gammaproteobacteria bacterium]
MHYTVIQRIIGQLLALFSITIIPPLLISFLYHENETKAFLDSYLFLIISGILLWLPVRKVKPDLRLRDGFLVVVLFWFILGASGALPLILYDSLNISISDAAFESVSALTTTGATVLVGLDTLPHSVLFYRQELQWLGGMGIIVLAVAILPMLGIGGMQLYRAETPGPIKDSKLTPRIAETAKTLWYIYVILTLICIAAYWLAGMSLFDAVAHAFATVSTGGLSTHDASIGYFDSVWIETIAIIFMALGGVNFGLHFTALKHRSIRSYFQDTEFRAYILILTTVTFICVSYLLLSGY